MWGKEGVHGPRAQVAVTRRPEVPGRARPGFGVNRELACLGTHEAGSSGPMSGEGQTWIWSLHAPGRVVDALEAGGSGLVWGLSLTLSFSSSFDPSPCAPKLRWWSTYMIMHSISVWGNNRVLCQDMGSSHEDINTIVTLTTRAPIHTGPITRARER